MESSITEKVRAKYGKYPYPLSLAGDSFDSFPQLCLSYRGGYHHRESLSILDAGCGTGACSLGTAMGNPTCKVVAADFNRQALAALREEAESWKLANLRVTEIDLNTLEGLKVPEGGFDVIVCGGVLHHLAEPLKALRHLTSVLAADGVMRLMVYNTLGREALYRFVGLLNLIHKDPGKFEQRLKLGRALLGAIKRGPLLESPWQDASEIDDVEFVDRYLNLHDTSYSVSGFMQLLAEAGLSFLRWYEPENWDLGNYLDDPELLKELREQPETTGYQIVEHLSNQVLLDAYVAHQGSRPPLPGRGPEGLMLSANPQVILQVYQQSGGGSSRDHSPRAFLRARPSIALNQWDFEVLQRLSGGPMPASAFLGQEGDVQRLTELLQSELVYGFLA